jgi:hypothetical protein
MLQFSRFQPALLSSPGSSAQGDLPSAPLSTESDALPYLRSRMDACQTVLV